MEEENPGYCLPRAESLARIGSSLKSRVQEQRPGVSTASRRLVMESFPLFSPRTSESPCAGTERFCGVPWGILQEEFGRDNSRWDPGSLQLPGTFLDLHRGYQSLDRREGLGWKTGRIN